jgi:hypothetical protein
MEKNFGTARTFLQKNFVYTSAKKEIVRDE